MITPPDNIPANSKFLEGVGESAWFNIKATSKKNEFIISRYTTEGTLECSNTFIIQTPGFDISKQYEFTYVSHCTKCTLLQNNKRHILLKIRKI
ncbi:MAG: hypothetical protein L3J35_06495 [Bacteroidales bacterium]|nr:hypothetical protein [Bacteroidales bacterium]